LEHEFSVPAPPDVVWAAVIDPERVAPCMPGATLTAVDGSTFSGGVKVKLGPVSLTYKGSGEFLETDEQARKVVIKASGKDARGNGTAAATVTVTLTEEGAGTKGTVVTDLTVTGKPAQFGRGMIVEVSGKILDAFAACLATKLDTTAAPAAEAEQSESSSAAADEAEEPPPPAKPKPATRRRTPAKAASTGAAQATAPADQPVTDGAVAKTPAAASELETDVTPRLQLVGEDEPKAERPAARQVNVASEAEAIDLLDYAGPSVAKRLIPVIAGVLGLVLLIWRLRARKS
jgi:carbon monoxide dehydrogenase subunit G